MSAASSGLYRALCCIFFPCKNLKTDSSSAEDVLTFSYGTSERLWQRLRKPTVVLMFSSSLVTQWALSPACNEPDIGTAPRNAVSMELCDFKPSI